MRTNIHLVPQLAQQLSIMTYLLNLALVFRLLLRTELVIVFILYSYCIHFMNLNLKGASLSPCNPLNWSD